ncbi:MAG TPA: homoprotocatechuate degradation operon regulator HpaR [Ramlibacter sp.]|nr:homoprotocatechuate degradation operon regulator HpaR [Ramlibacter sp.]
MTTSFKHRNLPRLLLQAREAVMAHARPSLRGHGLSDQQWRVLRVLGEQGTVETGRIAREAFILGPSLTGVLTRMERDGLIRRERDPADQRRSVVEATAKGAKLVGRLSRTVESHYAWMEKQLGTTKLAQLYRLLDELIALEGAAPEHSRRHTKLHPCESTTSSTARPSRATTTSRA